MLRLFPFCLNHAFGLRRRSCRRRRSRDGLPVPRTKSYVFNYSFDLLSGVLVLPLRKDRLIGFKNNEREEALVTYSRDRSANFSLHLRSFKFDSIQS